MTFELYTDKKSASGGNGSGDSGDPDDSGKGDGGETPDPAA